MRKCICIFQSIPISVPSYNEFAISEDYKNVYKSQKMWLKEKINKLRSQVMDAENNVVCKIHKRW